MDDAPPEQADHRIVTWAHMWAVAASQTYRVIESISMADSPASQIGRRDAMTMVLVDAVRNVMRGAELALGAHSVPVRHFIQEQPTLKSLRDRFEHYEEYLVGTGKTQRSGRHPRGVPLDLAAAEEGMRIEVSSGGGPEGHVVSVVVIERDDSDRRYEHVYEAPTRTIAIAARRLARDVVEAAGLLDARHLEYCDMCASPTDI